MTSPNLITFLGNIEDPFIVFASGSTPDSIVATLRNTIGGLAENDRRILGLVFLLGAVGQRRTITDLLMRPGMGTVNRYVSENWSIKGNLNFTSLNLTGNMIVAAHVDPGTKLIQGWRKKIGGLSLWQCAIDSPTCRLSEKAKQIAKEKIVKFTLNEVQIAGTSVIQLLIMGTAAPVNPPFNPQGFDSRDFFTPPNQFAASGSGLHPGTIETQQATMGTETFRVIPANELSAMTDDEITAYFAAFKAQADARAAPRDVGQRFITEGTGNIPDPNLQHGADDILETEEARQAKRSRIEGQQPHQPMEP